MDVIASFLLMYNVLFLKKLYKIKIIFAGMIPSGIIPAKVIYLSKYTQPLIGA